MEACLGGLRTAGDPKPFRKFWDRTGIAMTEIAVVNAYVRNEYKNMEPHFDIILKDNDVSLDIGVLSDVTETSWKPIYTPKMLAEDILYVSVTRGENKKNYVLSSSKVPNATGFLAMLVTCLFMISSLIFFVLK